MERREAKAATVTPARRRTRSVRPEYKPSPFREGVPRKRLLSIFAVVCVLLAVILTRVVLLQTKDAKAYREAGASQRESTVALRADRGAIFDRDGTELAISVPRTSIYANPRAVGDPTATAQVLAGVLQLDSERQQALTTLLSDTSKGFVYVARLLDDATAQAVLDLKLDGIGGVQEPARIEPAGSLASSVIGRTDIDGNGTAGLELQYDDILQGTDGEMVRQLGEDGNSLPGGSKVLAQPQPGQDLVLTIDRSMQYQTEQLLIQRVEELQAHGGTVIVMDTDTGEILTMANVDRGDDGVVAITPGNLAEVNAHEPGSVAKVFTMAAALNEGTVSPDTVFTVPHGRELDQFYTIHDAHSHETMPMTVTDILVQSSNVGTTMVSDTIGPQLQEQYMRAFGLGQPTGLGFPDESLGKLDAYTDWDGSEQWTPSYGYGFTSTSTQLIAAVNTIINDGVYVAPKLVAGTIDATGELHPTPPSETRTVLNPMVAEQMNEMMRLVVSRDDGTAHAAQMDGITVAGKTGTSYKADKGSYDREDGKKAYYASFVGTIPAEDPQITILVSIDEPNPDSDDRFGGTASAPLFKSVAEVAIQELQIKPPAVVAQ